MSYSQIKQDLRALLASFGSAVTYTPAHGPARSITAILEQDEGQRDTTTGSEHSEVVLLTVLRDASDARYGGIDAPESRHSITIDGDPDGRRYDFTGNIFNKNAHGWKLEFKTTKLSRLGAKNVAPS